MRCHSCRRVALLPICMHCRKLSLVPKPKVRRLGSGLDVISFYSYDELEPFLLTKHLPHGWLIYKILAKETFALIEKAEENSYVLPVDDDSSGGYSHTALLAKSLKRNGYRPLWGRLRAQNRLSYSGQPLSFRLQNPRDFRYNGPKGIEAVLVDDIVTTGLTLQEAHSLLINHDVAVNCAFVLADVDR